MHYLYGDSTPSQLTSNFLELLRDAIDFAVFVLQADERIHAGRVRAAELRGLSEQDLSGLDRFAQAMSGAIGAAEKGPPGSASADCAERLSELLASTRASIADGVRAKLAAQIAAIEAEEAAGRGACVGALETLLRPHTPPGTTTTLRLVLAEDGHYHAHVAGDSSFGLDWVFALAVPAESPWSAPLRLERLAAQIEIRAPAVTGWITKEVKVRPQRLERHVVTELTATDGAAIANLRTEPGDPSGFDLEADLDAGTVTMTRVGPSDDASVGPFEVHAEDQAILVDVARRLFASTADLARDRLVEATVSDVDFGALVTFVPLIEQLVAMLAPITREIAKRSRTPSELVLRRALADDRREELFVTKASLRDKLQPLAPAQRALFAPLALDPEPAQRALPPPPQRAGARAEDPPTPTGQLPPPAPPPAPAPPTPPRPAQATPAKPAPAKPAPAKPAPASPAAPAAPDARAGSAGAAPPASSSEPDLEVVGEADAPGRNEAFVEAVKRIVLVLRSGQTDEGYKQYAELLSSASFTEYRPDDQRQALKLLLLAKAPPTRSDAVEGAYAAALARIQGLVDSLAEPADYEMLGVAHLQLGDAKAASAAFDTALKLERARDPSSDLCASLMRRVSQLSSPN